MERKTSCKQWLSLHIGVKKSHSFYNVSIFSNLGKKMNTNYHFSRIDAIFKK